MIEMGSKSRQSISESMPGTTVLNRLNSFSDMAHMVSVGKGLVLGCLGVFLLESPPAVGPCEIAILLSGKSPEFLVIRMRKQFYGL